MLLGTLFASILGNALAEEGVIRAGEGEIRAGELFAGWGRGKKAPPTNFFPITSTNIRISPQTFLNFSFNPFSN